MAAYFEGERIRIRGQVRFKGGHIYSGYNTACRVELVPALGDEANSTAYQPLRYVIPEENLWFIHFVQDGYYYQVPKSVKTEDVGTYIDPAEFRWRCKRTNALWVMHPVKIIPVYKPNAPFAFPNDYDSYAKEVTLIYREAGYVYLLYARNLGTVRIGWTSRPNRRPDEISPSTPSPVHYLALLPGTRDDEMQLHYKFSHLYQHGSWYRYTEEMYNFVMWSREHWRPAGTKPVVELGNAVLPVGAGGIVK